MPEFLGIDVNVLSGTVNIQNGKVADVDFFDASGNAISFTLAPRIVLTVLNSANAPAFKVKNKKVGNLFTGFVMGFQNNVTVDVEWQAFKRG